MRLRTYALLVATASALTSCGSDGHFVGPIDTTVDANTGAFRSAQLAFGWLDLSATDPNPTLRALQLISPDRAESSTALDDSSIPPPPDGALADFQDDEGTGVARLGVALILSVDDVNLDGKVELTPDATGLTAPDTIRGLAVQHAVLFVKTANGTANPVSSASIAQVAGAKPGFHLVKAVCGSPNRFELAAPEVVATLTTIAPATTFADMAFSTPFTAACVNPAGSM